MAEARSVVSVYEQQKRGIRFLQKTDEGVVLSFSIFVPHPTIIQRGIQSRIHRFQNAIVNGLYPFTPAIFLLVIAIVMSIVVTAEPGSWWRSGWIAEILWLADSYIPGTHQLPLNIRVGYLAALAAVIGLLMILAVQRQLLRILFSYKGWLYAEPGTVLYQDKIWGMSVKLLSGRLPLTYSFQAVLPKLPVPSLASTIENYLPTVKPLCSTEEEFEQIKSSAYSFLKNEGPKLQRYLILKSWFSSNYMVDWWEKYVYLRSRSPIMINSNYYILDSLVPPKCTQAARTADIIYYFLHFRRLLEREELEPQTIRGVVPLCMHQYKRMFGTTRIPGRDCDTLEHHDSSVSGHIAVYCRGFWYQLNVERKKRGRFLGKKELERQIEWIMNDAANLEKLKKAENDELYQIEGSIAAFTADERTIWAEAREEFFSEGVNKYSLDIIEKAAFVLCLEDQPVEDMVSRGRSIFHGNGANRWFDKTLCLITYPNGRCGLNCEHSWADAPVAAHLFEWSCYAYASEGSYDEDGNVVPSMEDHISSGEKKNLKPPMRLSWDLPKKAIESIKRSVHNAQEMINNLSLDIICQKEYAKGFIKKQRISPDAYVQMVLQLAYYRDAGKFALTYEASMTRLFLQGRTETVRSLSEHSAEFVKAMENPNMPKEKKRELLRKAADHHQNYYRNAMTGKGVDRHIFALYVVSQGIGVEAQFLKEALSIPWSLSTSQQPQHQTNRRSLAKKLKGIDVPFSPGGGFGPVADDGYGVSYMLPDDHHIYFHISSKISSPHTDSKRFGDNILQAFRDVKKIFEDQNSRRQQFLTKNKLYLLMNNFFWKIISKVI